MLADGQLLIYVADAVSTSIRYLWSELAILFKQKLWLSHMMTIVIDEVPKCPLFTVWQGCKSKREHCKLHFEIVSGSIASTIVEGLCKSQIWCLGEAPFTKHQIWPIHKPFYNGWGYTAWKIFFGDFLGLNILIFFVNFFCLQNKLFILMALVGG